MLNFFKLILINILFLLPLFNVFASPLFIDIRIYSNVEIQKSDITIFSGKYELRNEKNEKIIDLYKNSTLSFQTKDSTVSVFNNDKLLATSKSFIIKGVGFLNTFQVEPVKPAYAKRIYDDNIYVKAKNNNLILINNIELERYIAGVVESEGGGSSKDLDFFLVQSITCRTYALANIRKHIHEGYNLCDGVHCQVYKGRCKMSHILMATSKTAGSVIVDEKNKMISSAFHSNSGGQTVNSEDVWTLETSYLRSIIDTFSLNGKNTYWEVTMPTSEWLSFLKTKYNYPVEDSTKRQLALNFKQEKRLVYFPENIHLKEIRNDLKLKSTFFDIIHNDKTITIKGRGFGHGVGMSQEGAIRMIQLGYDYEDVIKFYYQNVRIVSFDELDYFMINYNY